MCKINVIYTHDTEYATVQEKGHVGVVQRCDSGWRKQIGITCRWETSSDEKWKEVSDSYRSRSHIGTSNAHQRTRVSGHGSSRTS